MKTLHILVVDDEPEMRVSIAGALQDLVVSTELEAYALKVSGASSGEEGLALIRADRPDLVLLDDKMSGMSGLEVLTALEPEQMDALVVMIAADATIELAIAATKRGAYDLLPKPSSPDAVREVVSKAAQHLLARRSAEALAGKKRQVRFQFLSVLAHELKAPLGAIEGYLRILQERTLGQDLAAYDQLIQRTIIRADGMRKLIMDLLDLTCLESGNKRRSFAEVDLKAIAELAIGTVTPMALEHGISLFLHRAEPIIIWADRGEMEIVFNNLISNAVKYNRDGGRVDVHLTADEQGVYRIQVADTGIGLTEQEAAKLFQEFVRIKNDKTRSVTGSGLGLSILRKIVEFYHGDVRLETAPDVGSTFTVTLRPTREEARCA